MLACALSVAALSFTAPASHHSASHLRSRAVPTPQLSCDSSLRVPIAACALATVLACAAPALAVSGGGKDFSGSDISGQSFVDQQLSGKEFRGSKAKGTNFKGANLAGASFYKGFLDEADFTGANLKGASLEEAGMEGAILDGAVLESAYLTKTIDEAKSIKGADFTEAVMPTFTQKALCARADATGTNAKTGVDTRESLMCP